MPGTLRMPMLQDGDTVEFHFSVFNISSLLNYRVKYYYSFIKWCRGVACNWCASLGIVLIVALTVK